MTTSVESKELILAIQHIFSHKVSQEFTLTPSVRGANVMGSKAPNQMDQVNRPSFHKCQLRPQKAQLKGEITKMPLEQPSQIIYCLINTLIYYHIR